MNQDWLAAQYADGSSQPISMEASKIADFYALQQGNDQQQADAEQAYIQADL